MPGAEICTHSSVNLSQTSNDHYNVLLLRIVLYLYQSSDLSIITENLKPDQELQPCFSLQPVV